MANSVAALVSGTVRHHTRDVPRQPRAMKFRPSRTKIARPVQMSSIKATPTTQSITLSSELQRANLLPLSALENSVCLSCHLCSHSLSKMQRSTSENVVNEIVEDANASAKVDTMAMSIDHVSSPAVGPSIPTQLTALQPLAPEDQRRLMAEALYGIGEPLLMPWREDLLVYSPSIPEPTRPTNQSSDGRPAVIDFGDARQQRPDNNPRPPPRSALAVEVSGDATQHRPNNSPSPPPSPAQATAARRNRKQNLNLNQAISEILRRYHKGEKKVPDPLAESSARYLDNSTPDALRRRAASTDIIISSEKSTALWKREAREPSKNDDEVIEQLIKKHRIIRVNNNTPDESHRPAAPTPNISSKPPSPRPAKQSTGLGKREARGQNENDEVEAGQRIKKHRSIGIVLSGCPSDIEHSPKGSNSDGEDEYYSANDSVSSRYGTARSRLSDDEQDSVDRSDEIPTVYISISGSPSASVAEPSRRHQTDSPTPPSPVRSPSPSQSSPRAPSFDSVTAGDESDASSRKRARTTLKRLCRLRPQNLAPLSSPPSTRTPSSDSSTDDDESDASSGKRRRTTLELPPERQARLGKARRGKTKRPVPAWRDSLVRERGYKSS